jgi:hypothetical protein
MPPELAIPERNLPYFNSNADIDRIGHGLLTRTLAKPEWTHAAHFAAAVWILCNRPDLDAARDMPALIRAYNEATGVPNTDTGGYHETITQASIRAARAFLASASEQPLYETCNALMASPLGNPDWLLKYWSKPALFSPEARRSWLPPDKTNLSF